MGGVQKVGHSSIVNEIARQVRPGGAINAALTFRAPEPTRDRGRLPDEVMRLMPAGFKNDPKKSQLENAKRFNEIEEERRRIAGPLIDQLNRAPRVVSSGHRAPVDVVTIADSLDLPFKPGKEVGFSQATNNTFVTDTLRQFLGSPLELAATPGMKRGQVFNINSLGADGKPLGPVSGLFFGKMTEEGEITDDRIEISTSRLPEKDFARTLTHEFVHGSQFRGLLPTNNRESNSLFAFEQGRLENEFGQVGLEKQAEAIARALESIRQAPNDDFKSHLSRTFVDQDNERERFDLKTAKRALAFWYLNFGRQLPEGYLDE